MSQTLLLIDTHSLIHRAFHALPPLTSPTGQPTNAVYGFLLVLFKAIKELKPEYIAAAFDLPGPTFRDELFEDYKADRPKAPPSLTAQLPLAREVLSSMNIPVFELQGFEADDLIGAIASKIRNQENIEVIILSGDLDTLQLVDKNIKVYTLKKGVKDTVLYGPHQVKERFGLEPWQLADFKALTGDPSDNIPGVPGIGPKTASKLLGQFRTLENLYTALDNKTIINPALGLKLARYKDQAFLSKALALIKSDLPLTFSLKECTWQGYNRAKAQEAFLNLGFKSLIPRLP